MSLSARRRRRRFRLGLIFGVIALAGIGVGVRYMMVNPAQADTASDPRRDAGLAAFTAGDDAEVLAQLGPYLDAGADDTEARFALASVQLRQARAEGQPALLGEAVAGLRRVLRDQPNHREAAELLLPVLAEYPRGMEEAGLRIAERVLRQTPEHQASLRAQAVLLASTGRHEEALDAAREALQREPLDLLLHRLVLDTMRRQNQPDAALLDYATALSTSDPQQPAFTQVEAYARLITDDRKSAEDLLTSLVEPLPANAEFVEQQIVLMDAAAMFDQALGYLESLYAQGFAELDQDELIRRRFEAGRAAEALALIQTLERPTTTQRTIQALVLLGQQQPAEAQQIIQSIEAHNTRAHRAIAALLSAAADVNGDDGLTAVIDAGRAARDASVSNPYLDLVVAEAYEQAGQRDRAIARYQSALRQRPSWAAPCLGLAELYLEQDNATEANGYAVAAIPRQPRGIAGRILLAEAFADEPGRLNATQKQEVLTLIDQVQTAQPGEPRTLAVQIAVLAGTGDREAARQAMQAALDADPPLSQPVMVTLIEAAKRYDLDPEGEIQAAYVQRFGQTLAITMVQAQRLLETGDAEAALALFDQAKPSDAGADWQVNRALLLERMGRPEAVAAWTAVGEAFADDLKVQQAQLDSDAAWDDRAGISDAIERLRKLTGDDEARWRVERARWWLGSADPLAAAEKADELLDEALRLEPDSSEALALRGRSQRLLGNPRLAISLLSQAITQSPRDADAHAELAFAQRDAGSPEAALETARLAATMPTASPHAQRRSAQLMIDAGELEDAAGVLARLHDAGLSEPRDVFTLAQLYRQTQRNDRALALTESMLASPSPASIALAADLYAQAGQPDEAAAALAKLDTLDLAEADKLRIRAVHLSAFGDAEDADAAWTALLNETPEDADAWRAMVSYKLRAGRYDEALATAGRADAAGEDTGLTALLQNAAPIQNLKDEAGMSALALALLEEPENRSAAAEALAALERARSNAASADELADKLVALAETSPEFESLWVLSVSQEFTAGRLDPGLARAEAGRDRFPNSPRSARLLAEAYGVAERWRDALIAAEAWAALSMNGRWEADVLAARAERELGRPSAAADRLEPYADAVWAASLDRPNLTKELSLAWAATGRSAEAREVLEPLLSVGERWRWTWLDAAVLDVSSTRESGRWLERLEPVIPAEAWSERAALAKAWWAVGMRDSYAPFRAKGREMGEALTAGPGATAELWYFVGSAAEVEGDWAAAEASYREALDRDPRLAGASNNLAMLLADHGDVQEAIQWAKRTVEVVPHEPNFHDTLAYAFKRAGQLEEARDAIKRAIELDPGNPTWRTRLNEIVVAQ
ncbi:MAG: tetratricopeptide repeat protein [Planctomycetota bacterium]